MEKLRWKNLIWIGVLFAITGQPIDAQQKPAAEPAFPDRINRFSETLMKMEMAPGAAIVVVRDNKVLFNQGYGMADIDRKVTPETVFYIASSTKSFTALAAAICDQRGDIDLDATLDQYLEDATYHPDVDPSKISIKQLLSHTHGIDNDGPVAFRSAFSGQHTPQSLRLLMKDHGLAPSGNQFKYGNIGYNVAGMALENKTGLHWKELVRKEVLEPLGMTSTTGLVSTIAPVRLAMPYSVEGVGFKRSHYAKSDKNMHAAGGLVTTTNDLAKWLIANINKGRVDGKQVIPASVFETVHRDHATQDDSYMSFRRTGYGLGWNTGDYEKDRFIHHFGGFSGFHCHISFMPEHGIGVAILVNSSTGGLFADTVARFAYDDLLGKSDMDQRFSKEKLDELKQLIARRRKSIQVDRDRRSKRSQDLPHSLEAYTGTFSNEKYGDVEFALSEGKLVATMGPLLSLVEVYDGQKNALRVELTGGGRVVKFDFGDSDVAKAITMDGLAFQRVDTQE